MNRRWLILVIAACLGALASLQAAGAAGAAESTVLTLDPVAPISAGEYAQVTAHLQTAAGQALANQTLKLVLGDEVVRQARTDAAGAVTLEMRSYLAPGSYHFSVLWDGSTSYAPASAGFDLAVLATLLKFDPIPAVAAGSPVSITVRLETSTASMSVAGRRVVLYMDAAQAGVRRTGADGTAVFRIGGDLAPGAYTLRAAWQMSDDQELSSAPAELVVAPGLVASTLLTVEPIPAISLGERPVVVAHLVQANGQPVAEKTLELHLDGALSERARSDSAGRAEFSLSNTLDAGSYAVQIVWPASSGQAVTSTQSTLTISPSLLLVQTVPPLPGVVFAVDGQQFSTDEAGLAQMEMSRTGDYTLELLSWAEPDESTRAKFSRWGDEVFALTRTVRIPALKPLEAGFDVSHRIGYTFADQNGVPIPTERVLSVTVKGSNGASFVHEQYDEQWLLASRVVRRSYGLEASPLLYSVNSVIIDGTNVVNQAQQRFYVYPDSVWPLQLLLYSARFQAVDALFRFPVGTGLRLEYPSGKTIEAPFGAESQYWITGLARGLYYVTVLGAPGMAPRTPIALSRDQDVELLVLSALDMAFGIGAGALLALGLLVIGRPQQVAQVVTWPRRWLRRRSARAAQLRGQS